MRPLVISSATPRATYMTPSVATKAGTLNQATSMPLSAPTSPPSTQVRITTAQTGGNRMTPNIESSAPFIM